VQRSTDRILTTHTGSLPRPKALYDLLVAKEDGQPVDASAFHHATLESVREVVAKQIACGVDIVNDGEMSKISYATYVKDRLTGFDGVGSFPPPADMLDFPEYAMRARTISGRLGIKTPACDGPIAWRNRAAVTEDIDVLREALTEQKPREVFMTAASPGVIALFLDNAYYASREEYLNVVADTMRDEYEAIVAAGYILQLDCPDLASGRHTRFAKAGIDEFLAALRANIAAINRALVNIPADRVRIHLCWGNYEGPHHLDVPLRDIIETVFQANVGGISFEGANPRHEHEWSVFKDVRLPAGSVLIPGVIDSSTNYIEHPELVAERIVRYAELVGRENVIAGCDCGFATFAGMQTVEPAIAWAKLASLAEGARIATTRLW